MTPSGINSLFDETLLRECRFNSAMEMYAVEMRARIGIESL